VMADKLSKEDLKFRNQIAARLREIREKTGKSQTQFSYELNVDSQSVYVIKRYCKLAGVPLEDFFKSPIFK
jgi:transcriptional regulator with XRE-family HTH domain